MLVLSRRVGESLIIGNDVKVTMIEVEGGQIKLGICAPKEVAVHRQEVHQRIKMNESRVS
jgi:carbon storage regulator